MVTVFQPEFVDERKEKSSHNNKKSTAKSIQKVFTSQHRF